MNPTLSKAIRYSARGAVIGLAISLLHGLVDHLFGQGAPTPAAYMIGLPITLLGLLVSLPLIIAASYMGIDIESLWILPVNLALWGFVIGLFFGWREARRTQ